jgi:DNA-binding response OmpR family regulator
MKEEALQMLLVKGNAEGARVLREMFSREKPGSFEFTMNKKFLIIEDDAGVRLGRNIRLKADNRDVFFPPDGLTNVADARQLRSDLTIQGLALPGGDGFVVIEGLKSNSHLAVIPIIVASARAPHTDRARALPAGAKAFYQKQLDNDGLLAVVRQRREEINESKLPKTESPV